MPREDVGAGVDGDKGRVDSTVDEGTPSAADERLLDGGNVFICAAVVRIAFRSSKLFCCRFLLSFRVGISVVVSASDMAASSSVFFFSSDTEGSTIGHANPVLGVYSGLYLRNVSRDAWRECSEVSYYKYG